MDFSFQSAGKVWGSSSSRLTFSLFFGSENGWIKKCCLGSYRIYYENTLGNHLSANGGVFCAITEQPIHHEHSMNKLVAEGFSTLFWVISKKGTCSSLFAHPRLSITLTWLNSLLGHHSFCWFLDLHLLSIVLYTSSFVLQTKLIALGWGTHCFVTYI